MRKSITIYFLALVITLLALVYQKLTGPTYPKRGKITVQGETFSYRLPRSHDNPNDTEVRLTKLGSVAQGVLTYRKLNSNAAWTAIPMQRQGDDLVGPLPHQPPAGKLEYFITLQTGDGTQFIGKETPIQIRFHGMVPIYILHPHILFMFAAMWASTVAGLLAVFNRDSYRTMARLTLVLLFIGGMILGPLVQKFAFGQFWTGVPFGCDLTDNKTLIAFLGWVIAVAMDWRKNRRGWVIAAALLLLIVYSIPHSLKGSQLDYSTMKVKTG